MLQAATIQFLGELNHNNHKAWFDANRKRYEYAKADFELLVKDVLAEMAKTDSDLLQLKPKDCVFRINRDVRFSKDKSPYKTNMAMYISKGGKKTDFAGYYFHCEPGKAFIAGGIWMPMPAVLQKVRQEIDYNIKEWQAIFAEEEFAKQFKELEKSKEVMLSRPPKGYSIDNPAIEFIKMKSFIASTTISNSELASKTLSTTILNYFHTLTPLVCFLNKALDD